MKLIRNLFLLAALVLGGHTLASAQVFEWAQLARNCGRNLSIGQGATTDPMGNTYAVFSFVDSARVGGRLVRHPGNVPSGFQIVKYDSTGRTVWVKATRGVYYPYSPEGNGLKADPVNGGFFVTGSFYVGAKWDGVPIPAAASLPPNYSAGFYGKCDANGVLLWTRPLLSSVNAAASLAVDGLGNCYIVGGNRVYDAGVRNGSIGGVQIDSTTTYIVGNNAAGTGEWVRLLHGTPLPTPAVRYAPRCPSGINGLQVGSKAGGGCLLFGTFNQALYFGTAGNPSVLSSRTAINTFDDFIASVSPTGALSWIRSGRLGGTPTAPVPSMNAVTADLAGNYYVTGNSAAGVSLAKYSPTGTVVWVANQTTPNPTPQYCYGAMVVVDAGGEATIQATVEPNPGFPPSTIGGFELSDYQHLIHFDATGVPRWVTASRNAGDPLPQRTASDSGPVALGVDAPGNVYYVSFAESSSPNVLSPSGSGLYPPTFLLGELTQVGAGISVARIGTKHNTVRGRLYLDANGNGRRDNGEGAFPTTLVLQGVQNTRASLGTFDTTGVFNLYVGAGAYTLPPPTPPLHYALTQPTSSGYAGNFSGFGRVDTARHFGFRAIPNQLDLRATLTAYGAARPGFLAQQRLTLDNVGTTTIPAGTATITLDPNTTFVGSYPSATSTGRVVRWNYPAIPPFGRRNLDVTVQIPASTPLFTTLTVAADASVTGDLVPVDNTSITSQSVTGSFDPNDIAVSYERLSPAQVASQLPLDYTIRFQNLGTDTAFTVVVTDTLNFRQLDLTTLQLVAESHTCQWSMSSTGQLVLRFLNIHLPYKAQNELGSQGFVRFRVRPKTTLALGDLVHNTANVFFDYNVPVRTNTATTAVLLPAALAADARATAFVAYPNPARESVSIAAELATAGTVRLSVFDALGRPVLQQQISATVGPLRHMLTLGSLRPGLYVLRLQLPDGTAHSQRVVVE